MTRQHPVLEVGGSHATGALIDLGAADPVGKTVRLPLDSSADAASILGTLVEVSRQLGAEQRAHWAVAFPGPFDYATGVGRFAGVGKFDALHGVDVRQALADGLGSPPESFHFLNDADAFGLGVWAESEQTGRLVCLTLGTGVGSAFVADGVTVDDGETVPRDAEMHFTQWQGKPLEDTVSHRAIVRAYAAASGVTVPGVREVVERSQAGDAAAAEALRSAFTALGAAVAPWLDRFGATDLAFGGSMAAAWDVIEPPITAGLRSALRSPMPRMRVAPDTERAALIGAAFSATGFY
jgi:glucokinase